MMNFWRKIEKIINWMVQVLGYIGWALILYCMLLGVTDVFLRYVFNAPSLWISTTIQAAMVLMACVGGAYALNADAFVKLDLFYASFSVKKKAVCDIITVGLTFCFFWVLITKGITMAKMSLMLKQVTPTSVPIPIYPIKIFIPFAGFMTLLVVIKKLVNDIITVCTPSEDIKECVEVTPLEQGALSGRPSELPLCDE